MYAHQPQISHDVNYTITRNTMFGINALTGNKPADFRSCLEVAIRVFDVGTNVVAPKNAKAEQQFFFRLRRSIFTWAGKSSSGIYVFFRRR